MIKYKINIFKTANIILDSLLISLAVIGAYFLRIAIAPLLPVNGAYTPTFADYLWSLVLLIPLWNFLLYMYGLYPANRLRPFRQVLWIIVKANVAGGAVCVLILYFVKIYTFGRVALAFIIILASVFLVIKELVIRYSLRKSREKGIGLRNLLIAGDCELIPRIIKTLKENPYLGLKLKAVCLLDDKCDVKEAEKIAIPEGMEIFDKNRDIRLLLLEHNIDNVVVAVSKERLADTEELLLRCEESGVEMWLYADFFELMFAQKEVDAINEVPFLVYRTTPTPSWAMVVKRGIDVVGSIILMVLTSPFFLFAMMGVKLTSPGPAIFKQKRIGLYGRKFVFYKFRSMSTDAEQRRQEFLDRNIMSGPVFKIKDDPRITPFGRFLRRSSIDELPQLWNVLKGDMSLVGPRPPLSSEVDKYRGWQRRRLSMRPGITCLWQVRGRNKITDFDEWAKLDLEYIDNWSLFLDLKTLLRTVLVVLTGYGAE